MFSTILGGLLRGLWFPVGVMLYYDESCNGDVGSLAKPKVNIGGACTG